MAGFVYGLCALTSLLCALLLLRAFFRTRSSILWWSGLCFCGLTMSNTVLIFDKLVYPDIDLLGWRSWTTLISLALLVYGLINAKE
jgi:hypothetical protein